MMSFQNLFNAIAKWNLPQPTHPEEKMARLPEPGTLPLPCVTWTTIALLANDRAWRSSHEAKARVQAAHRQGSDLPVCDPPHGSDDVTERSNCVCESVERTLSSRLLSVAEGVPRDVPDNLEPMKTEHVQ